MKHKKQAHIGIFALVVLALLFGGAFRFSIAEQPSSVVFRLGAEPSATTNYCHLGFESASAIPHIVPFGSSIKIADVAFTNWQAFSVFLHQHNEHTTNVSADAGNEKGMWSIAFAGEDRIEHFNDGQIILEVTDWRGGDCLNFKVEIVPDVDVKFISSDATALTLDVTNRFMATDMEIFAKVTIDTQYGDVSRIFKSERMAIPLGTTRVSIPLSEPGTTKVDATIETQALAYYKIQDKEYYGLSESSIQTGEAIVSGNEKPLRLGLFEYLKALFFDLLAWFR